MDGKAGSTRTALGVVVVVAAVGALIFEQSPANEMLRTNAALRVLERTGRAWRVGLAVAGITLVIEMAAALLMTAGLHLEGGPVERLKARLTKAGGATEEGGAARKAASLGQDLAVALGLAPDPSSKAAQPHRRRPDHELRPGNLTRVNRADIVKNDSIFFRLPGCFTNTCSLSSCS